MQRGEGFARQAQAADGGINRAVLQPGESWQPPAAQSQGFAPQTLQGQLLLSGKPPLNLARYIRELKAYPYGGNRPLAVCSRQP